MRTLRSANSSTGAKPWAWRRGGCTCPSLASLSPVGVWQLGLAEFGTSTDRIGRQVRVSLLGGCRFVNVVRSLGICSMRPGHHACLEHVRDM